jgi:MFS family permease
MSDPPNDPEGQPPTNANAHEPLEEDPQALTKTKSYDQRISQTRKNIFMVAVVLTQLLQMIPFGTGINSGLSIAASIGATPIQATWIAASYPLTQGTFVLIGGRLGAVYGHKNLLAVGCFIWVVFCLGSGFAKGIVVLGVLRGFTGIGGGLMVPNAVAILGITFPPGKQRNLSFALFGAMAPVGAAGGALVSAVFVQLTEWKWVFFFL